MSWTIWLELIAVVIAAVLSYFAGAEMERRNPRQRKKP
jgi:membrane protein implicated in regulation of membrane protease activity